MTAKDPLHELAHTLRTPIAVVQGFAELLTKADTLNPEQTSQYAERIRVAAGEMRDALDAALAKDRERSSS